MSLKNPVTPPGIYPGAVRLVAQCLNHYTTPGPFMYVLQLNKKFQIIILPHKKGKGKAVPLQAWSGPEGSRKLRFPDFMTTAQDCGKVVSLTHRLPLPPGNTPGTHFC
jgi:hypothetical protein